MLYAAGRTSLPGRGSRIVTYPLILIVALQVIGTLLLATAAFICVYHLLLSAVVLCLPQRQAASARSASHHFAIVIPAHNEESVISQKLRSCAELDYPAEKFIIYVIVDNCTDRTAGVAAGHGATCWIRRDDRRRGKGYALEWAFARLQSEKYDAFVVLDADCRLDRHALRRFKSCLAIESR